MTWDRSRWAVGTGGAYRGGSGRCPAAGPPGRPGPAAGRPVSGSAGQRVSGSADLAGLVQHQLDRQLAAGLLGPGAVLAAVARGEADGGAVGEAHGDRGDPLAAARAAEDAVAGTALGQGAEGRVDGRGGAGHGGLLNV